MSPVQAEPATEEGPPRFRDLPSEFQLEVYLRTMEGVAAKANERIEAMLMDARAREAGPSNSPVAAPPTPIEAATERDPIGLSPAGKFQSLLDAADE